MSTKAFLMILRKEFKDSIKSKWLIAFAVTFFFLALGVPYLLLGGGGASFRLITQEWS